MVKTILFFILLVILFWNVIQTVRYMTGKQAFAVTKIIGISLVSATLTTLVMGLIVWLF